MAGGCAIIVVVWGGSSTSARINWNGDSVDRSSCGKLQVDSCHSMGELLLGYRLLL